MQKCIGFFFIGEIMSEPIFKEPTTKELQDTFDWYDKNIQDYDQFVLDYFQRTKSIIYQKPTFKIYPKEFAYYCRVLLNNSLIPYENLQWFLKKTSEVEGKLKIKSPKKLKSRSEGIIENTNQYLDRIEESLYILIETSKVSIKGILIGAKSIHAKKIKVVCDNKVKEYSDILTTRDKDIQEAYQYLPRNTIKGIIKFYQDISRDCDSIIGISRIKRKRKVKPKKILASFCENHPTLPIKGIHPESIIGSKRVVVFDIRYRKLGCYYSDSGLDIKGTTIQNFDSQRSTHRILRKPDRILTNISGAGIVEFNKAYEALRTIKNGLTGRLSKNTLILYAGD